MSIPLTSLRPDKRGRVVELQGGWRLRRRMMAIGVIPGKSIRLICHGPFSGPLVVDVGGVKLALGRGMASKILVEELK